MKKFLPLVFLLHSLSLWSQTNDWDKTISWIPFTWLGDTSNNGKDYKGAMFLSIRIEGIDGQFKMQFDNGSPVSMLYEKSFRPFLKQHPALKKKIDPNKPGWINSVQYPTLNVPFSLGKYTDNTHGLVLYKNYGEHLSAKDIKREDVVMGTIGADIFKDRILVIDYPGERIAIMDTLPRALMRETTFTESKLEPEGRMLISGIINGKHQDLLFDTGSTDELYTDMKRWESITGYPTDTVTGEGWGRKQMHYGAIIMDDLFIGGLNINGKKAYGNPDENFSRFYDNLGIFGIVGNALYYDDVIILDYKGKMFGLVNRY